MWIIILIGEISTRWGYFAMKTSLKPQELKGGNSQPFPWQAWSTRKGELLKFQRPWFQLFYYNIGCFCYESLLHIPCTVASLSGYLLVVCDKSYKENASWKLVPSLFLHPIVPSWAECLCNSKSCSSSLGSHLPSIPLSLSVFPVLPLPGSCL